MGVAPAYGYGYGYGPLPPRAEQLATVSLVCGLIGLPLTCCWVGAAGSVAAIATGVMARRRIAESNGTLTGEGMAMAGIVLGAVGCLLLVAVLALTIVA